VIIPPILIYELCLENCSHYSECLGTRSSRSWLSVLLVCNRRILRHRRKFSNMLCSFWYFGPHVRHFGDGNQTVSNIKKKKIMVFYYATTTWTVFIIRAFWEILLRYFVLQMILECGRDIWLSIPILLYIIVYFKNTFM
jgi:uncharacterized membrane protein YbaN (DUF454 family)